MQKSSLLAIVLIAAIALTACSTETPTAEPTATVAEVLASSPTPLPSETPVPPSPTATMPTPTQTSTPTPEVVASGPDNFPADINPLTGLRVDDLALLDRRPMSIKVQLIPRGQRPPYGVGVADLVFDYYQNNGLTRLHAVFYGLDASRVSPIRSARIFDGELVEMYKSIFAFGGADRRILNRLFNGRLDDFLIVEGAANSSPLKRIEPNTFNYLTVDTAELSQYADAQGIENSRQNLNGMTFDPQIPANGQNGEQVFTRYSISSYVRWDYDATSGRYLRFQDTQEDTGLGEGYAPLMDGLTNQQIAADNVLVLYVLHEYLYKSGNSEIIDIKLADSGKGYAYRDGRYFEITWRRSTSNPEALMTFTLNVDGSPYPLKPGNTWFQIIGQSSRIETEDNGALRFISIIP